MTETILSHTARIVSAHIANNTVRADQLPTPIREVHRTLSTVGEVATKPMTAEPAVEAKPAAPAAPAENMAALDQSSIDSLFS